MKISVNQDYSFQLEQVYLPITLVTNDKEEMSIIMRDSGFEFKYQGDWYIAKNNVVEPLMVQETFEKELEKAAKSYRKTTPNQMYGDELGFIAGAEWQEKRMYSEEEVNELLNTLLSNNMCSHSGDALIEQFKKR
jgi:hypothetical protein